MATVPAEMARSDRGPAEQHRRLPRLFQTPIASDRLVFDDAGSLIGVLCPECNDEVLGFTAEYASDCKEWPPSRFDRAAAAQARHWTEELSAEWTYIIRSEANGSKAGGRVHLPHCPALKRVVVGSNYYGATEKPEGIPECRVCFGWTGYQGPAT